MIQFGIDWSKTPAHNTNSLVRRYICAQHKVGNVPVWEHRKAIMQTIWPKDEWTRWQDWRLKSFSESSWVTWLGPGGSAKSTDAARFALEYWMERPMETVVILCSTTTKMLKMRVWSEIIRLYNSIPDKIDIADDNGKIVEKLNNIRPGRLISTETKIMWAPGDDKHGLTGVAVEEGPIEQVVSNHLGVHAARVLLVMDEMQAIRPAILKAAASNMAKNKEFKLLGLGNPDSFDSLLAKESEPINGWSSIDMEKDYQWKTLGNQRNVGGLCVFTDGRKSPANDSSEEKKRLHFLINQDWIDDHLYRLR